MTYQILYTLEKLHEQLPGLVFTELLLHYYVIEKLSFWRQLEHQVDAVSFVERILEAEDIGVTDTHQYTDLLLQALRFGAILHPRLFCEDFDRITLPSSLFNAKVDLCKMAFAKLLKKSILL
jgi:hypothetical protein